MKNSLESRYTYEGNDAHSLDEVFMERHNDSLYCAVCTASVCDHRPVSLEDMPINELRWIMTVDVCLPLDHNSHWDSGCRNTVELVDTNHTRFIAVLVNPT